MASSAIAPQESKVMCIKDLVDSGLDAVPPIYVRPASERPDHGLAPSHLQYSIPVIDLALLHDHNDAAARASLIRQLSCACEEWGFFQVINHGIEVEELQKAALKFFMLPSEERMQFFSSTNFKPVKYTTSFNLSQETIRDWKDTLTINRVGTFDGFQQAPNICKREVQEYIREVEALANWLYMLIFQSMGLDKEYIEKEVPGIPGVVMGINYYPPCPDPTLTLGVCSHSDSSSLTILHAGDVPGLQIKHKGTWVPIFPVETNAFIINLGDQIEILTNGKYKSIEHRATTNGERVRLSIACFFGPSLDTIVAPVPNILNENSPPGYKPTKFQDYVKNVFSNTMQPGRVALDFARV